MLSDLCIECVKFKMFLGCWERYHETGKRDQARKAWENKEVYQRTKAIEDPTNTQRRLS